MAGVEGVFLSAGCARVTGRVMKCLATFRVSLGGQPFPSTAAQNRINGEEGKCFCVCTESLYKMAGGNKECNDMSGL